MKLIRTLTCLAPLVLLLTATTLSAAPKDVLFIAVDDLNDWTSYLGVPP